MLNSVEAASGGLEFRQCCLCQRVNVKGRASCVTSHDGHEIAVEGAAMGNRNTLRLENAWMGIE